MRKSIYQSIHAGLLAAGLVLAVGTSAPAQLLAKLTNRATRTSAEAGTAYQSAVRQPAGTALSQVVRMLEQHYQTRIVYEASLLGDRVSRDEVVVQPKDRLETVLTRLLKPQQLRAVRLKGGGYTILPVRPNHLLIRALHPNG